MYRLVLLLILLPLSLSQPTLPLSLRWQYINYEDRPSNCVQAPTTPKPKPQSLKRQLLQLPSEEKQPNPFTAATTTSPTTVIHRPRGNPLCYYPTGRTSTYLYEGYQCIPFILPAGIYALKWNTGHSMRSSTNISCLSHILTLSSFTWTAAPRSHHIELYTHSLSFPPTNPSLLIHSLTTTSLHRSPPKKSTPRNIRLRPSHTHIRRHPGERRRTRAGARAEECESPGFDAERGGVSLLFSFFRFFRRMAFIIRLSGRGEC